MNNIKYSNSRNHQQLCLNKDRLLLCCQRQRQSLSVALTRKLIRNTTKMFISGRGIQTVGMGSLANNSISLMNMAIVLVYTTEDATVRTTTNNTARQDLL